MTLISFPENNIRFRGINRKLYLLRKIVEEFDVYIFDVQETSKLREGRRLGAQKDNILVDKDLFENMRFFHGYKININNYMYNEVINFISNVLCSINLYLIKDIDLIINLGTNLSVGWPMMNIVKVLSAFKKQKKMNILLDMDEYLPFHQRSR